MSYPVLAFHGTQEANIHSICSTGFRVPGEANFEHATDTGKLFKICISLLGILHAKRGKRGGLRASFPLQPSPILPDFYLPSPPPSCLVPLTWGFTKRRPAAHLTAHGPVARGPGNIYIFLRLLQDGGYSTRETGNYQNNTPASQWLAHIGLGHIQDILPENC